MRERKLTPKQERFIQEYLLSGNATKAYKLAYNTSRMKPTTINRKAKECLDHGMISARIREQRSAMAERAEIDQDMLTKEYARVAFLDFRIFFDSKGQLIPVDLLSDDAAAALASLETVMVGTGDEVGYIKKIRTYDKLKALADLGKHLGFFKEDNNQKISHIVITRKIIDPEDVNDRKNPL